MAPDEYTKALDKALLDLGTQVQNRDLLNASIAGLRETVRVLSSRVEMSPERQRQVAQLLAMADSATPKVTDAIRSLLITAYPKEMTAIEVRNTLEEGSNFDDFNNSLSACHAALKRMLSDGEVELGVPKDGKASYRWVLKLETSFAETLGALNFLTGLSVPRHPVTYSIEKPPVDKLTPEQARHQIESLLPREGKAPIPPKSRLAQQIEVEREMFTRKATTPPPPSPPKPR